MTSRNDEAAQWTNYIGSFGSIQSSIGARIQDALIEVRAADSGVPPPDSVVHKGDRFSIVWSRGPFRSFHLGWGRDGYRTTDYAGDRPYRTARGAAKRIAKLAAQS